LPSPPLEHHGRRAWRHQGPAVLGTWPQWAGQACRRNLGRKDVQALLLHFREGADL